MISFPSEKFCFSQTHDGYDVTSLRFSRDEKYVAIGLFNGNVILRDPNIGKLVYNYKIDPNQSPISSMKFHPAVSNTLFCSTASGAISSWHIEAGQKLWEIKEKSDVTSFDLAPKGNLISVVGGDPVCRVYDYPGKQCLHQLQPKAFGVGEVTGHVSRVFATVFRDQDVLGTCGWDQVALIWDLRVGQVVQSYHGPKLSGQSMAFVDNYLVTASCRVDDQIQVWDLRKNNQIFKQFTLKGSSEHFLPYSLCLSHDKLVFAVGGYGENRNYFFDSRSFQMVHRSDCYSAGVNCVDFSRQYFAYGLTNSLVSVTKFSQK